MSIATPNTFQKLICFIGAVNYYRGFESQQSNNMSPFTTLAKAISKSFLKQWKPQRVDFLNKVKEIIAHNVIFKYPDLNNSYLIQTDASKYQLDAVIYQDKAHIALFSHKLTPYQ